MPRRQPFPPPLKLHKSSGQARARWQGRDHYFGPWGEPETEVAYARWAATLAPDAPAPQVAPAPCVSVADVVAEWELREGPRYSDRGRERAQFRASLRPLLVLFGPTPAADLDADRLETVQLAMASGSWMNEEERARRGERKQSVEWCRNVVNRRVVRIRTVWRWAERKKLVPPGRWAGLCSLPGLAQNDPRVRHTARPKAAGWADVVRVVRQAPARVRAMILLQWFSGMRSGEVRIMRASDIDRTGDVWIYRPSQHKNDWRGHDRVVPLGKVAQKILTPFLASINPDACLFPPVRRRAGGSGCYTCHSYAQVVRRSADRAGVAGFHGYLCRHAARLRITQALGLDAARSILGHRSVGTTNDYAAGVDEKTARDAARRLG
jgi:integrase